LTEVDILGEVHFYISEGDMDGRKLGKKLRKMVEEVAAEPIPPRLARLLDDDPPPFGGASGARPVEERKGPASYRSAEPKVMRRGVMVRRDCGC
jgi:hypothetical protein